MLALSDEMALGAQRQLGEGGWQVGRDYLLLGFDGNAEAAQAGLSSVAQPMAEMGEAAAETMLAALGGQLGTLIQRSFAPTFVERASTRRGGNVKRLGLARHRARPGRRRPAGRLPRCPRLLSPGARASNSEAAPPERCSTMTVSRTADPTPCTATGPGERRPRKAPPAC